MTVTTLTDLLTKMDRARADEPAWLAARRRDGHTVFQRMGLPGKRVEAWKWSDLHRAVADAKPGVPAPPVSGAPPEGLTITLRDGRLDGLPAELPPGLSLSSLRDELVRAPDALAVLLGTLAPPDNTIAALNMAVWDDGVVLRVAKGTRVAEPVHLVSHSSASAGAHGRAVIVLEEGAALTMIASDTGGTELGTFVTEAWVGCGAKLTFARRDQLHGTAQNASLLFADLADGARYDGVTISEGAGLARRESHITLSGPGARADLTGALVLSAGRHSDETVVVRHRAPGCESRQAFRAVAGAGARAVVQGRIEVGVGAQKTDARQNVKGLLLAPRAEIDAKPELEIFADDVACAHGTAIGEIDPDQLFYLRARGVPEPQARALLIEAFLSVAFDTVEDESVRALMTQAVASWAAREHGQ